MLIYGDLIYLNKCVLDNSFKILSFSNIIELSVQTSCYSVLDLLCVKGFIWQ